MQFNNSKITVEDAIKVADVDNIVLKRRKEGILLSDYQVNVLNKNGIYYDKYNNIHDLLFCVLEKLEYEYDDELDFVSSQIAELMYYKDTKK